MWQQFCYPVNRVAELLPQHYQKIESLERCTSTEAYEQTVVLINANISYVFKDAFGRPKFMASDAGIDINNLKPAFSTQSSSAIKAPDGRPASPPWPWSADDQSDGAEPSRGTESSRLKQQTQQLMSGRKWYYWESETAQVSSPIISTSGAINELDKYVNLWTENTPIWNAYTKVGNDGRALHTAAAITKNAFEKNKENSFFQGERNKADFTNFLTDGTLPPTITFSGGKITDNFADNLTRRLNIQFYGIIYLKKIDNLNDKTLKIYQADIRAWEALHPGQKHGYKSIL